MNWEACCVGSFRHHHVYNVHHTKHLCFTYMAAVDKLVCVCVCVRGSALVPCHVGLSAPGPSLATDTRLRGGWELLTRPPGSKRWSRRCGPRAEQSGLCASLSWAWENSGASRLCLHFQAGRQVDVQVLHSAAQALVCNVFGGEGGGGGGVNNVPYIPMTAKWRWMAECSVEKISPPSLQRTKQTGQNSRLWLQHAAWPLHMLVFFSATAWAKLK